MSTTSNYINKINQEYPLPGQDNDSSGFRNNFKNIKSALTSAEGDISSLKLSSVKLTETNNFNNNIIKRAVFQETALAIYDETGSVQSGNITLDYINGSYQKIRVDGGTHVFTVINWPSNARSGSIILSVITDSISGSYVDFNSTNFTTLGPSPLPLELSANVEQFFELWCDGDSNNLFVRGLGGGNAPSVAQLIAAASIAVSTATSLTISTNEFSTSTYYSTKVKAGKQVGNIALVPNQIIGRTTNVPVPDVLGNSTATTFPVISTVGIMTGAKLNFPSSTSTVAFTVTSFTTSTVTVSPAFEVTAFTPGDYITFTNPQFTDQPTVITFKPTATTSTISAPNDLKGQIYANTTTLFVTVSEHSYNTVNKVKISGDNVTMVTQTTATNTSTSLATTEFVHNILPYGSIIMWNGPTSKVTGVAAQSFGWQLCDGTNGTPDLRNKFVIGASSDRFNSSSGASYAVTEVANGASQSGGTADSNVVKHTHTITADSSVNDPGHTHEITTTAGAPWDGVPRGVSHNAGGADGDLDGSTRVTGYDRASVAMAIAQSYTGIKVNTTVLISDAGVDGVGQNLPPYYALCYIMKITGTPR